MVVGATVCQTCDRSQSSAYERGKQLLTFFGVVGAIASATAFVWPFTESILAGFTDPQIEVDFLRTESTDTLIRNIGQRPVVVTHFEARLAPSYGNDLVLSKVINEVLAPGEVVRPDLRSNNTLRIQSSETLDFYSWMSVSAVGHQAKFLKALFEGEEQDRDVIRVEVFGDDTTVVQDAQNADLTTYRTPSELMLLSFSCEVFFSATDENEPCSLDVPCFGIPSTSLSELEFVMLMGKY